MNVKRFLSLTLAMAMLCTLLPGKVAADTVTVMAPIGRSTVTVELAPAGSTNPANADPTRSTNFRNGAGVSYVDASGNSDTCTDYTALTSSTTTLSTGWYVVAENVTIDSRIEVSGTISLILCDDAVLTVPKGIYLTGANSLTVWGQSEGTGELVIESPDYYMAGIGGNLLEPGGVFTMNGGTIRVTGGGGSAGIGGGGNDNPQDGIPYQGTIGAAGTITINGGTVTATGGNGAAGIGCGVRGDGGTVTINGGTVTATGSEFGAGIGGAECSYTYRQGIDEIRIHGGSVTATGGYGAAGIGGGIRGRIGMITITSGTVVAIGGDSGAGIGSGYLGGDGLIELSGGTVTAAGGRHAAGIGGGTCVYPTVRITGGAVTADGGIGGAGIGGGYNGGSYAYTGGFVTITGGNITANGGDQPEGGAGIGGGMFGPGGDILISGGTVRAAGGGNPFYSGAGIGGGLYGDGGNVTITGGTVRAAAYFNSVQTAQAIGHGSVDPDSTEELVSGTLHLGDPASGIHIRVGFSWGWSGQSWVGVEDRERVCRRSDQVAILELCAPHNYDRTGCCTRCGESSGPALQYTPYVNAEGTAQSDADCQPLTASTATWDSSGACRGWFAVTQNVTISDRVAVHGNVNLILCDGATLTVPKGIELAEGNSLTVWRQEGASGALLAGASCDAGDAGIGGSSGQNAGTLTLNGGNLTAAAGTGAQAIGHGAGAAGEGSLLLHYMRVYDSDTAQQPVNPDGREAVCRSAWVKLTACLQHQMIYGICQLCDHHLDVSYLDPADGNLRTCTTYRAFTGQSALTEGWYVLPESVQTDARVTVTGNVDLILTDGMTWDAAAGIEVASGGNLTVWAQSNDANMGVLIATGASGQAGIGIPGSALILNGGSLTVTGGSNAAGIGGGNGENGGAFSINGGSLTVRGGAGAQAIGCGAGASDAGSLALVGFKVGYCSDTGSVEAWAVPAEKESVCRNTEGRSVRVERCEPHVNEVIDAFCDVCGLSIGIVYLDPEDGELHLRGDATIYQPTTSLSSGWYLVDKSYTTSSLLRINGDVHLILGDGVALKLRKGIEVQEGNSLTIWAQSAAPETAGKLTIDNPASDHAGIGGAKSKSCGSVTVNGGVIQIETSYSGAGIGGGGVTNENGSAGDGGTVTIRGGLIDITAKNYSAGIGGGSVYNGNSGTGNAGNGGTVLISGGTVNITCGNRGAGIGGGGSSGSDSSGGSGGHITISGGTVNITNNSYGAAIGGGCTLNAADDNGGTILISGGAVNITTKNTGSAAAIGGSAYGNGGDVTIRGGTVTITGNSRSAKCIGGGEEDGSLCVDGMRVGTVDDQGSVAWAIAEDRVLTCRSRMTSVCIEPCSPHAFNVLAVDNDDGTHTPICRCCGLEAPAEAHTYTDGICICGKMNLPVAYVDPTDPEQPEQLRYNCTCLTELSSDLTTGWYVVLPGELRFTQRMRVTGNVNLILSDGALLTAVEGIEVSEGNALTVWAQSGGTGQLDVPEPSTTRRAGIGGDNRQKAGTITINGGTVNSTGARSAAGIGSGTSKAGGTVTVNAGTVNAVGGSYGAGIGGGGNGVGGTVTIHGGSVNATGGIYAAGIGGGSNKGGGAVIITGGTVTAIGGTDAKAFGKGGKADANAPDITDPGSLHIGVGLTVCAGEDAENASAVLADGRVDAAQSSLWARVEPCTHSNPSCTDNGDGTHTVTCPYCAPDGLTAAHSFANHVCVCGAIEPNTALPDGYYLIGPDWTVWSIDEKAAFTENPKQAGEYMLATALAVGDERKVVHVSGGEIDAWYPDGMGNNYTVDAGHAGLVTAYFRPDYTGGDDWHAHCLYVAPGRDPFIAHSITLGGEIGENFIINVNGVDAQDLADAYVTFSWDVVQSNGTTKHNEQALPLSWFTPMTEAGYNGCYKIPVGVSAKEMGDSIHAELTVGGKTYADDYTVKAYADRILANEGNEFDDQKALTELQALCRAMLSYGAAAQNQFGYRTDALVSTEVPEALTQAEIEALHSNIVGALPDGIVFVGSSLLLKSETVYRLYFTVPDGVYLNVSRNDDQLMMFRKGGYWCVDIPNLAAKDILSDILLSVNGVACTFNAGYYIKSVLTDATVDPTLVNTVTALYRYCKAAAAYFAAANAQP